MVFEDESLCFPYIEGRRLRCHCQVVTTIVPEAVLGLTRSKSLQNRYVVSFVGCRAIGVMASSHSAADKSRDGAVVARWVHIPKVVGSIPTPATFFFIMSSIGWLIR